jgi:hypothetical protein
MCEILTLRISGRVSSSRNLRRVSVAARCPQSVSLLARSPSVEALARYLTVFRFSPGLQVSHVEQESPPRGSLRLPVSHVIRQCHGPRRPVILTPPPVARKRGAEAIQIVCAQT